VSVFHHGELLTVVGCPTGGLRSSARVIFLSFAAEPQGQDAKTRSRHACDGSDEAQLSRQLLFK